MDLETIWAKYRSGLKAFLHSKVSNEADVDDLLQDILIKTHQHLHTVRSEKAVKSWLFQIASHTITDYYRRNGKVKHIEREAHVVSENDENNFTNELKHGNDQDSEEIKQALAHCIEPFVQALSAGNAGLLTAIELGGMSQKDYAAANGIPYSTLKSRVKKARTELWQVFDDCCHMKLDNQGNLMDYDVREDKIKSK